MPLQGRGEGIAVLALEGIVHVADHVVEANLGARGLELRAAPERKVAGRMHHHDPRGRVCRLHRKARPHPRFDRIEQPRRRHLRLLALVGLQHQVGTGEDRDFVLLVAGILVVVVAPAMQGCPRLGDDRLADGTAMEHLVATRPDQCGVRGLRMRGKGGGECTTRIAQGVARGVAHAGGSGIDGGGQGQQHVPGHGIAQEHRQLRGRRPH